MEIEKLLEGAREDYSVSLEIAASVILRKVSVDINDLLELFEINHTWKVGKQKEEQLAKMFEAHEKSLCLRFLPMEEDILSCAWLMFLLPGNSQLCNRLKILISAMKDFDGPNKMGWEEQWKKIA